MLSSKLILSPAAWKNVHSCGCSTLDVWIQPKTPKGFTTLCCHMVLSQSSSYPESLCCQLRSIQVLGRTLLVLRNKSLKFTWYADMLIFSSEWSFGILDPKLSAQLVPLGDCKVGQDFFLSSHGSVCCLCKASCLLSHKAPRVFRCVPYRSWPSAPAPLQELSVFCPHFEGQIPFFRSQSLAGPMPFCLS